MRIPHPTSNHDQVLQDVAATGVAIIDGVLSPEEVAAARACLDTIAHEERRSGSALLEDGAASNGSYRPGVNQRVGSLVMKDALFGRLATHPPFPILLNAVVPLVDFTMDNGATRVAAGTHLADSTALSVRPPDTQPVEAAAGSAILIDGRTWHGTGANRSDQARPAILLNYCPPWVRPFANHGLDVDDRFLETAPTELLRLLGYEPWLVFGMSEARQLARMLI